MSNDTHQKCQASNQISGLSQPIESKTPETGTPKLNAAIDYTINYSCAFPAVTRQIMDVMKNHQSYWLFKVNDNKRKNVYSIIEIQVQIVIHCIS